MQGATSNYQRLSFVERRIFNRYAPLALPRHTSYPAVPFWNNKPLGQEFSGDAFARGFGAESSIYIHVPFCQKLCFYCACNKLVVPKSDRSAHELETTLVEKITDELDHWAPVLAGSLIKKVHLGGGTPSWLQESSLRQIFERLHKKYRIDHEAEIAVELDPRVTSEEQIKLMAGFGVNRASLGIQDFNLRVQRAINRVQPFDTVSDLVGGLRANGINQINFDLIYGLPFQDVAGLSSTIKKCISLKPSRIAFYRLALLPDLFKWQRRFSKDDLPNSETCLEIFETAIELFESSGFDFIGLDHFATPEDLLAKSYRLGTITRDFQGMTTGGEQTVVGIGPSAIHSFSNAYAQNEIDFFKWRRSAGGEWGTKRSILLDDDDLVRRKIISDLYCYGKIDVGSIEMRYNICFKDYFSRELDALRQLEADGLVTFSKNFVGVTDPLGRILVRIVASVFDKYIPSGAWRSGVISGASRVF